MKKARLFFLSLLTIIICSCSDIVEKSISNQNVSLLAPGNNDTTDIYTQTFIWNSVDNALTYELQLASPNFTTASVFIDTTISTTKFTYSLTPGAWEWQVRAKNGSSETPFTKNVLYVMQTSITKQHINLTSPTSPAYTNNPSTLTLNWATLTGATQYVVKITSGGKTILDTVPTNQFSVNSLNLVNGIYSWSVTGINGDTSSISSAPWTFTIDETFSYTPDTITLTGPANKTVYTTLSSPVKLTWSFNPTSSPTYTAPIDHYNLNVYQNGSLVSNSNYTITIDGTNASALLTVSATNPTTYTWNVQAVDMAGNKSPVSTTFSFSVP